MKKLIYIFLLIANNLYSAGCCVGEYTNLKYSNKQFKGYTEGGVETVKRWSEDYSVVASFDPNTETIEPMYDAYCIGRGVGKTVNLSRAVTASQYSWSWYEEDITMDCICNQEDIAPVEYNNTIYQLRYDGTINNIENHLTVENALHCKEETNNWVKSEYRIHCVDKIKCWKVDICNEDNISFPTLSINEQIYSTWIEDNNNISSCAEVNGVVQEAKVNCESSFRCVTKTDSCPTVPVEPINSYVNPRDRAFHEDIELDGIGFGLHYKSAELNATQTLAKGWTLSNHHFYKNGKLYRGDGITLVATASTTEGENIVINSAGQEFVFDASLRQIETRDAYTNKTLLTFAYENEKLVTVTDEFNKVTTLEYDNGVLSSIVAPHGQTTAFSINDADDLLEVQYEDGSSYAFEYQNHLMTKETEPKGNVFLHMFDAEGRVTKVIDAEQGEWSFNNDASPFGTKTVLRASGDTVRYKNYALENGMLKFETYLASGNVITTLKAVDDSQESRTSCGITNTKKYKMVNGKLQKDPINHRRVLESVTTKLPSGLEKKQLIDKVFGLGANGTLNSLTLNTTLNGKTSSSVKDYQNHTTTQTSPMGKVNEVKYGANNTLVAWSKPYGLYKTTYRYDNEGRVTQVKQAKRKVYYRYDARGNLASTKDAKGRVTTYAYDSRDRLVKTTYSNGNTIQNSYDKNGNMTVLTTPTPSDHTFAYNGVNKRVSMSSPLHATTAYAYDKARRVIKVTKPSGKIVHNNYHNEKLSSTVTAEGTTNYTYACQGSVASKTKGSERIAYEYDGTLLTKVTQSGQLNQTLNMSYNNDFALSSLSYAGATTNYSYNQDNEVVKVGSYDIVRTKQNRKVKISDGTYKQVKRFNKYGELIKLKDKRTLVKLSYNKNGQIVKKVEKIGKKRVVYHYTYDKQSRLIKVKKGNKVVERYTYDSNGNRASAKVYGKRINASYTLDDQLEVYGNNTYRYDEDGYLKEKSTPNGTTTYTYGTFGELQKVVTPTKTIEYLHNADNQRVAKKVDGQIVEKYFWANLTTLLAVYDADDNLKQRFDYANGRMPISMTKNGKKYYLHYDQVGTLKAISNKKQRIIKKITYDTYGNILFESNKKFKVPFGFAGGLYDQDTKLTRFGFRDYDAQTGKWTAKDPIDFGGGDSNLYGYVLQDPVGFVDVSGLDPRLNGRGVPNAMGGDSQSVNIDGGAGAGVNAHLGLIGWSQNTYITYGDGGLQKVTVTCGRIGLGIFFGGGSNFMGGTSSTDCDLTKDKDGCTKTWSLGLGATIPSGGDGSIGGSVAGGPSGVGGTFDAPIGSPGAGLYGGFEGCEIITCPI